MAFSGFVFLSERLLSLLVRTGRERKIMSQSNHIKHLKTNIVNNCACQQRTVCRKWSNYTIIIKGSFHIAAKKNNTHFQFWNELWETPNTHTAEMLEKKMGSRWWRWSQQQDHCSHPPSSDPFIHTHQHISKCRWSQPLTTGSTKLTSPQISWGRTRSWMECVPVWIPPCCQTPVFSH